MTQDARRRKRVEPRSSSPRGKRSTSSSPRRDPFVLLLIPVLLLHVWIAVSVATQPLGVNTRPPSERAVVWPLYNDTVHRVGPGADLFAVYHAGVALEQGVSPYLQREQPRRTPYFYPFRYLPVVGQTLGRALIQFSPRTAYRLWVVVLELLLFSVVALLAMGGRLTRERVLILTTLLLGFPYFLELHMGQFTFAAVTLLALSILLVERQTPPADGGRSWRAAVGPAAALAAGVTLKLQPLVAAAALVRQRRYWLVLGGAVAATVVLSAPFFLSHGYEWPRFRAANVEVLRVGLDAGNFGVAYLLFNGIRDVGVSGAEAAWPTVVSIGHAVLLAVTAAIVLTSRMASPTIGATAMIAMHFIGYGHVWEHHYSALAVMAALAWHGLRRMEHPYARWMVAAAVWLALPTPFFFLDTAKDPSVFDPSTNWPAIARYILVMSKALPAIGIYGLCVATLVRDGFALPWRRHS